MALHSTRKNSRRPSAKPAARRGSDRPRAAEATIDVERSKAVKKTWKDPKVAAARAERTKVKVNGTEYRSVNEAFIELKLPFYKHAGFRKELKASASGRLTFDNDGTKYIFTIVKE